VISEGTIQLQALLAQHPRARKVTLKAS